MDRADNTRFDNSGELDLLRQEFVQTRTLARRDRDDRC